MSLLLDTSAVIGWFERRNATTVARVSDDGETPTVHAVTLGELADGWQRAIDANLNAEAIEVRRATFETVREHFHIISDLDPLAFAAVSHVARRSLSHNDLWIVAGAVTSSLVLLTEDRDVATLDGTNVNGNVLRIEAV